VATLRRRATRFVQLGTPSRDRLKALRSRVATARVREGPSSPAFATASAPLGAASRSRQRQPVWHRVPGRLGCSAVAAIAQRDQIRYLGVFIPGQLGNCFVHDGATASSCLPALSTSPARIARRSASNFGGSACPGLRLATIRSVQIDLARKRLLSAGDASEVPGSCTPCC
jgi:hypothetical protein